MARFAWYLSYRERSHLALAVLLAAACLGIVRFQSAQRTMTESDLAWYNGRGEFRLEGVIQQPPQVQESRVRLLLSVDQLTQVLAGQPQGEPRTVSGLTLAYLPLSREWRYGDRIQLSGMPKTPEIEGSDYYHDYLARQGIHTTLGFSTARLIAHDQGSWFWAALYDFRALADRTIVRLLPQPESALLAGILLGDDSALPTKVADAFRATGITHIIAVSGQI